MNFKRYLENHIGCEAVWFDTSSNTPTPCEGRIVAQDCGDILIQTGGETIIHFKDVNDLCFYCAPKDMKPKMLLWAFEEKARREAGWKTPYIPDNTVTFGKPGDNRYSCCVGELFGDDVDEFFLDPDEPVDVTDFGKEEE